MYLFESALYVKLSSAERDPHIDFKKDLNKSCTKQLQLLTLQDFHVFSSFKQNRKEESSFVTAVVATPDIWIHSL